MQTNNEELATELLHGAIDMHQHSLPCLLNRPLDHADVARQAKDAGMRAVVIKCHHHGTADRVYFVRKMVPGIDVFGTITLNYAVGGLNPFAVDAAIKFGAVKVFMPTVDALWHQQFYGTIGQYGGKDLKAREGIKSFYSDVKGITILDDNGSVRPELLVILDLIAEANIILSTGHLSVHEIAILVPLAKKVGVNKIVVDHPHSLVKIPFEQQKELVKTGAYLNHVFFEKYLQGTHETIDTPYEKLVEEIREVGVGKVIISSDMGQIGKPMPAAGLKMFIKELLDAGVTENEIKSLVQDNPSTLLYQ